MTIQRYGRINTGPPSSYSTWASPQTSSNWDWTPPSSPFTEPKEHTMLEKILRLYTTAMVTGVTSPLPHLFGPPGSGKSTVLKEAADLIGVRLHTINLSRISPLELEGVQMPTTGEDMKLRLLHATYWTQIKEGDIVLFDEFLRAFPEVHNGLLDILTAREVGGLTIPRAFFMGASNSVISYDKALEDRLLHLPVNDPRKSRRERERLAQLIVDGIGLLPAMVGSIEMANLISQEVEPMYEIMDHLKKRNAPPSYEGSSVRNLIGQAKLREVQSSRLRELIDMNNHRCISDGKLQFLFLLDGKHPPSGYQAKAPKMLDNPRLSATQRQNVRLNLELIAFEETRAANNTPIHPYTGGSTP
jgi:AAA domain (dynein-related subfamily)